MNPSPRFELLVSDAPFAIGCGPRELAVGSRSLRRVCAPSLDTSRDGPTRKKIARVETSMTRNRSKAQVSTSSLMMAQASDLPMKRMCVVWREVESVRRVDGREMLACGFVWCVSYYLRPGQHQSACLTIAELHKHLDIRGVSDTKYYIGPGLPRHDDDTGGPYGCERWQQLGDPIKIILFKRDTTMVMRFFRLPNTMSARFFEKGAGFQHDFSGSTNSSAESTTH